MSTPWAFLTAGWPGSIAELWKPLIMHSGSPISRNA